MARACDDHDLLVEEVIKYQCPGGLGFGLLVICLEQRHKIGIAVDVMSNEDDPITPCRAALHLNRKLTVFQLIRPVVREYEAFSVREPMSPRAGGKVVLPGAI
jgi:hypothetical protein